MATDWTHGQIEQLTMFHQPSSTLSPHLGNLLTIGYTGQDAQQRLEALLAQPSTVLVDIRFKPRSRWRPEFNQAALMKRYGSHKYEHCQALGNMNYNRPGEPIKIWKPEEGVQQVIRFLRQRHTVILLCACKNYFQCHRRTAYELVVAAFSNMGEIYPQPSNF